MEAQQAFRFLTRYLLFLSLLVKLFGAPCGSPAKDLQMQGTFPLFSLAAPPKLRGLRSLCIWNGPLRPAPTMGVQPCELTGEGPERCFLPGALKVEDWSKERGPTLRPWRETCEPPGYDFCALLEEGRKKIARTV